MEQQPMDQEMPMGHDPYAKGAMGGPPMGPPGEMGGMDPQGAPQPPAPAEPISPTDLAIGEAVQQLQMQSQMQSQEIQQQIQALQQQLETQDMNTQNIVGALQHIQDRSLQLSQASGGQIPPGSMASPMMSAQAIAPEPEPELPPPPMMDDESGQSPEEIAQQINPNMVDQAAELQDSQVFDTAAIAMLAAAPVMQDIVTSYLPNMEKALDNAGRVLLTLWMKETELKEAIGDQAFVTLEEKLRNLFKGFGEVILTLTHNALNTQTEAERYQHGTPSE
jgi:hypothetical protein